MSVTLTKGVAVVILSNPQLGDALALKRRAVVQDRSDGGVYVFETAAGHAYERTLQLDALRRPERDALSSFFDASVRGPLKAFTFTDERGDNWNARFLDPQIEFTSVGDAVASAGTFASGGKNYPTTTRSGGYYSTSVRLKLW